MSVINTNTIALNAQRNLSTNSASLSTTIQRLSSGSRINSAKDDAAGLAISQRFTTQVRGMDVAIRNANDGISLAQTAEGSLSEIGNNLQRVRELANQAANATNSTSDRQALQAEVTQLMSEIDRVAKQSDFNGTKLLDGSFSGALFQVGANAGQSIAIDKVVDAKTESLGKTGFESAALTITAPADGDALVINGKTIDLSKVKTTAAVEADPDAAPPVEAVDGSYDVKSLTAAINAQIGETGVYAEVTTGEDGVEGITLNTVGKDGEIDTAGSTNLVAGATTAATTTIKDIDISSVKGAQQALTIVDEALGEINNTRADLGAIQNRFSSVVANLQTSGENLSAARSRIMDTDFAKETAELSRTQILQQAGTAMLAQANQIPQNVLSLLR
ncbi:flagellin [Luteimonas sp. FCS-9]|uniref:flagellin n=1 Tax=Luteimonas sp. FCS-9 TaxID=1547516 RepID=UPI00063E9BD7|nr:flagellin [Luteimonas sp. FCS-9]KLJ02737.1 flagellin [Luteimonas sp. FCS-9]